MPLIYGLQHLSKSFLPISFTALYLVSISFAGPLPKKVSQKTRYFEVRLVFRHLNKLI